MSHECINWEVVPPHAKTPFIRISYRGTKVVTRRGAGSKVREFKALQAFAHNTFSIQGRPVSSLRFQTTCNLCCAPIKSDSVFEVDENAWEEEGLRDLVGCLEVSLPVGEYEEVQAVPVPADEPPSRVESPQLSYLDGEPGAETSKDEDEPKDDRVHVVPEEREEEEGPGERSDVVDDDAMRQAIRSEIEEGEKENFRISSLFRRGRRVVGSDKEDGETPNHELAIHLRLKRNAQDVDAPIAENKPGALHPVDLLLTSEFDADRVIKKIKIEKEEPLAHRQRVHRSSTTEISNDSRVSARAPQSIDQPVKQEPVSAAPRRTVSQPQAGPSRAIQEAEPAPELPNIKLVISIQHRPSVQQAQFSVKSRTRVGKLLAGACKSFRLDVNVAQLYLVIVTENDQGLKEEDYFLCDKDEMVENAIAGMGERVEFMIRMPEDPVM
ncbi:hypothetical protein K503DRAFT_532880 [Rhizopogon vinicolor AM-OR11-026]|uniref:Uncharacterized protein n=1 Tax=Rhizopogon vinicolor AM-OR11-026 TaxID=1314800 RepID=A0A1B7ML55_9AGAM|nr:hypothetical protein K503DRAFT_532880 [Rhizopogon vinicolor AM-OR11-026]